VTPAATSQAQATTEGPSLIISYRVKHYPFDMDDVTSRGPEIGSNMGCSFAEWVKLLQAARTSRPCRCWAAVLTGMAAVAIDDNRFQDGRPAKALDEAYRRRRQRRSRPGRSLPPRSRPRTGRIQQRIVSASYRPSSAVILAATPPEPVSTWSNLCSVTPSEDRRADRAGFRALVSASSRSGRAGQGRLPASLREGGGRCSRRAGR